MDRLSRSDEDTFKNQHKVQDYHYVRGGIRQSGDERALQDRKLMQKRSNEDDEDDDYNENFTRNDGPLYANARAGLCAVCNLTVGGTTGPGGNTVGFEQALTCNQGHLLCQRCVQRFAIRSDMGCVLCRTASQHSHSSGSRGSTVSLNRMPERNARTIYDTEDQSSVQPNTEEYNEALGAPWARAQSEATVVGTRTYPYQNGVKRVDSYSDWDTEQSDIRDERFPSQGRQHQQRSYCSIIKKELMIDPNASETRVNGQIVTECSRRPIRCPRLDCAVNVAFSALTHHFLFDHPEVPILSVEPGAKSTLIVSFAALSCNSSRCLALLLVSGKLSGPASRLFNGSQIHPKYRNRLPLPVLAARLHCNSRYTTPDEVHAGGEGHGSGDVIIAWVAGLDIGNVTAGSLRCSIQAVDNVEGESVRSLTYTGPVNSLRTAQRPREVFLTGDCVILHEGFINHITSDCTSLNVNVTVH